MLHLLHIPIIYNIFLQTNDNLYKLHPTPLSSHQHRELMASLKIGRKPQANFWSIISRFPPSPYFCKRRGEYKLC